MKRESWRKNISKFDQLTEEIYSGEVNTQNSLFKRLEDICGRGSKIKGTDTRVLALIEFSFYKAEGPYSMTFLKQVEIIRTVLNMHPPIRNLLNSSANHAIANMVLDARGNLKFKICDRYELIKVLKAWTTIGLKKQNQRSVFNAILDKPSIQNRLKNPDYNLIARLESIFPRWKQEINPQRIDVQTAIFNLHRFRFEEIVKDKSNQGLSLKDIIASENRRELPPGIKRNSFLSYLTKKKHNFTCQLQKQFSCTKTREIQSHHIIPIFQGGEDHSSNLIVLCSYHHKQVHTNRLEIGLIDNPFRVKVSHMSRIFHLKPN